MTRATHPGTTDHARRDAGRRELIHWRYTSVVFSPEGGHDDGGALGRRGCRSTQPVNPDVKIDLKIYGLIARGRRPTRRRFESATVGKGLFDIGNKTWVFLRLVIAMEVGRCREGPDGRRRREPPRMHLLIWSVTRNSSAATR